MHPANPKKCHLESPSWDFPDFIPRGGPAENDRVTFA
jgi:hypothetical protein